MTLNDMSMSDSPNYNDIFLFESLDIVLSQYLFPLIFHFNLYHGEDMCNVNSGVRRLFRIFPQFFFRGL